MLEYTTIPSWSGRLRIDPSNESPVFKQIADYLRSGIAAGIYRPDEALPSKRALAIKLNVNPLTVQHAYSVLEREGLVFARKGVGMFVTRRGVGQAQTRSERACLALLSQAFRMAREADLSDEQIGSLVSRALRETAEAGIKQS